MNESGAEMIETGSSLYSKDDNIPSHTLRSTIVSKLSIEEILSPQSRMKLALCCIASLNIGERAVRTRCRVELLIARFLLSCHEVMDQLASDRSGVGCAEATVLYQHAQRD